MLIFTKRCFFSPQRYPLFHCRLCRDQLPQSRNSYHIGDLAPRILYQKLAAHRTDRPRPSQDQPYPRAVHKSDVLKIQYQQLGARTRYHIIKLRTYFTGSMVIYVPIKRSRYTLTIVVYLNQIVTSKKMTAPHSAYWRETPRRLQCTAVPLRHGYGSAPLCRLP